MAELEGKTLDHFELRKLIGKGGMADVYEGYDRYLQREVAVKVFKREDDELLRRFIREANLMASLHNKHLVTIYSSGECQVDGLSRYYIIMPFMEGGTLRAHVRRTPFSLAQACECLQEIAPALDYMHSRGIIHRDIKSSNVLLDADGRYYLSDFGIARMTTDVTQLTSTGNVLGTVDYIAPELFEGNRKADALTDLYSLGVLLFEMVTGRLPFYADNQIAVVTMHVNKPPPLPRSINQNIPPQVERVILKSLEKKSERRYQSAIELANAFCSAVAAGNTRGVEVQGRQPEAVESVFAAETIPDAPAPVFVKPAPTPTINRGATPPEMPPTPTINRGPTVAPPFMVGVGSGGGRPLEDRPIGRRLQQSSRLASPARQRTVVVTVLSLLILLLLAIPVIYVATHRSPNKTSTTRTTPAQIATIPTATQSKGTTITPTAIPDLAATAQAAAVATSQAQDKATATVVAGVTATAQASAAAQAVATATAVQDEATATAIAGVTATVQAIPTAQAQATVGVIQTATAGTPSYEDALTTAPNPHRMAQHWDENDQCTFMSDGYHVTTQSGFLRSGTKGCRESNRYDDVAISVDVRVLSGHTGGLLFRVSTEDFTGTYTGGYLFEIDSTGDYRISRFNGSPQPLDNWTPSSALKTGSAANTLQVVAQGGKLLFYANGVFLTEVDDAAYISGYIAFLATTNDTATAIVVFSNLKVYSLP